MGFHGKGTQQKGENLLINSLTETAKINQVEADIANRIRHINGRNDCLCQAVTTTTEIAC